MEVKNLTIDQLQVHKKLIDKELTKRVRSLASELGITKRERKRTGHIVDTTENNINNMLTI